jgi:hypothetical protein
MVKHLAIYRNKISLKPVVVLANAEDYVTGKPVVVFGTTLGETMTILTDEFERDFKLVMEREDIDVNRSIWPN